ncbi:Putative CRAL-TRIO lipid binding domain, CRAL/TRIO domain, CRAL/TRIO domain superfamily [Septoria linicola]|uniref:CRAL-TRIO lipid binding domain, CRAL/TRIO domain, CRAL/TRIO domain superfamily n=1 Tax=Septoria linicola TaxID=215465 RepID=A0A9Q9B4V3_9PEZI|nr:Putative CRAL-TRIO lipid binding domain, CRAL/TRIO domain, CRAL/TRIO domain superfamily [Septoria linicola]
MAPYGDAPGRPGNLTAEQEQRLKDMWISISEIAGMEHATNGTTPSRASTDVKPEAGETTPKKKSRFGFGRSKKDKAEEAEGVTNDKHGQTKEYEQALASLSPEQIREALWLFSKHDDPDALLLRFLRARKWDVQNAMIMMISTMHWRLVEQHVDDDIMLNGEGHALRESASSNAAEKKEGEDFMAQLRMGKSFLHGVDKDGRPCCYVRVKLHRQGEQSEKSLERFTVYTIETARMMLRPPVDTATIVFDMTDFSMANMDYTPVKFMIKCFEANYPESLGSVVVYKSPWIFQGIWKIIRGWLDPVVASKVHFASNVNDLEQFIPRSQIMKDLGGDEDWTYSYPEPQADEDAQMKDTATRDKILAERKELVNSYEQETAKWMHGEDKGEGRTRLAQRLAENYWKLDPYVRARSMYDRSNVIQPGGKLDFYPKSATPAAAGGNDDID